MKILMTLMGLEIGGAETHVAELCRELARRGHDITVASNGGVYVPMLEECGVKHIALPLHSKRPDHMIKSYNRLYKLIKTEKFDLVHAHARIPAFICGLIAKRIDFRFMTSTHGVFKVDPILTRLTDWGERAVAVSCDIKQYLIENYGFPSDSISLTINGIDTERFAVGRDCSKQKSELGLGEGKFRVVYVSRIDNEVALTGFLLCDALELIGDEIPELEVLMVGGGTAFERLSKRADEVNRKLGREVIKLTGARTDVAELISTGDCFAGVSRAALEAMSMEKPVVLAGAQGYIGLLTEDKVELARSTNFCCRGEKMPDAKLIADDIRRLRAMSDTERESLGKLGRRVIIDGYSVAKMADDYLCAYEKLRPFEPYKQGEIIISGYYGFANMGDDSLLYAMLAGIRRLRPDAKITVLTSAPKRTSRVCGVRCINRFNIPAVAREMKHAKLLISGGGSLLQDGTSVKSLIYYVYIMRMAKKHGLKLAITANGLGPLNSASSRSKSADILAKADYVSLREEHSLKLALSMNCAREKLRLTADPAFLLEPASDDWVEYVKRREGIDGRAFVVSVKDGNNYGEQSSADLIENLAADIREAAEKYSMEPIFIPMHEDKDSDITRELARLVGRGKVITGLTAPELCGILRDCELAIGMRLHTLIFAARMGIPPIGIAYDPKIDALLDYLGLERGLDVRTLKRGQVSGFIDRTMSERETKVQRLKTRVDELRRLADSDCEAIVSLLGD